MKCETKRCLRDAEEGSRRCEVCNVVMEYGTIYESERELELPGEHQDNFKNFSLPPCLGNLKFPQISSEDSCFDFSDHSGRAD